MGLNFPMPSTDRANEAPAGQLAGANGIRGFACLWVLVVHNVAIVFPATYAGLTGCGKIGVWLFFVLSAYLLTYKLRNSGMSGTEIGAYFHGRFWRIIPAFGCAVVFYKFAGTAGIDTWSDVRSALFLERGFAHLWTIPVEFKFYFLLPALVWLFGHIYRKFGTHGSIIAGLALVGLHQCFFPFWRLPDNSIEPSWYIGVFLVGIVAAYIPRTRSATSATWWGVGVLLTVVALMPFVRQLILGLQPTRYLMNKYLVLAPLWAAFIVTQAEGVGVIGRFLRSRPMALIGQWSYSIYLLHWFFAIKAHELAPNQISAVLTSITLSLLVGCFMYWLIEMPARFCRRMFPSKLRVLAGHLGKNN